jgi:uncharacterized protein YebE (UPF0316 family)
MIEMILWLVVFYIAGLIQDFFFTLNWRYVAREKVSLAALCSFATTVIYMVVLYNIIARLDTERSILAILCYSLGIASGTVLAMKVVLHKEKRGRK